VLTVKLIVLLVELALTAMLQGLNTKIGGGFAGSATVSFWSGKVLELGFGGSLLGVNVPDLVVTPVAKTFTVSLTSEQAGSTTAKAAQAEHMLVVDYSLSNASDPNSARKTALTVRTGSAVGNTFKMTLDGTVGELTEARGHLTLNVLGFVAAVGDFGIVSKTQSVTLDNGNTVQVDALLIGGSNLNAFAGMNGSYDSQGG
jgi:hypothetical protein